TIEQVPRYISIPCHTAAPEPYTLSLHDALPIWFHATLLTPTIPFQHCPEGATGEQNCSNESSEPREPMPPANEKTALAERTIDQDRKSTRLNSSHVKI